MMRVAMFIAGHTPHRRHSRGSPCGCPQHPQIARLVTALLPPHVAPSCSPIPPAGNSLHRDYIHHPTAHAGLGPHPAYNSPHEHHPTRRPPQHRHHRPRGSRQDDPGGRHAAPGPRIPRQPGRAGAGAGRQPVGAGAGHHHPGQEHGYPLARREDQPGGHARPRRLRRRGRAGAQHGGRRAAAGGRRRRPHAPDALRPAPGAGAGPPGGGGGEQDGPAQCPAGMGGEQHLRSVRGPGRHRRAGQLPGRSTPTPSRGKPATTPWRCIRTCHRCSRPSWGCRLRRSRRTARCS